LGSDNEDSSDHEDEAKRQPAAGNFCLPVQNPMNILPGAGSKTKDRALWCKHTQNLVKQYLTKDGSWDDQGGKRIGKAMAAHANSEWVTTFVCQL
jgi:hypothetical protein